VSFAPADFPGFGGLNLAADAEDSSGALDLSNVTLSQPSPSRLLPRPGYTLAGTLDLSTVTGWSPVGSSYLMGGATTLQLVAAAGTQTATGTFTTGDPWTVVPFGNASSGDVPVLDNPSFATNAASWVASFSSITRDTGVYDSSAASGRWDNTGASDNLGASDELYTTTTGTFHAGVPYVVLVKIRPSAGVTSVLTPTFGTSTDYATTTWSILASTSWQTFGVVWVPETSVTSPATTVSLTLRVTTAGACYYNVDSGDLTQPGIAYACNGAATGTARTSSSVATPTAATKTAAQTYYVGGRAAPKPYTLAAQPKDNRLVAWGFGDAAYGPNGAASSGSHAFFSQPNSPEKWDETDYVVLALGDGETGRAAATYNDFLFLFKQSKFFVFYGNSVDSTGGTVFNYRTVGNAFGGSSSAIYQGQVCSAPSGVYVITDTGVWKTTGGAPQLVSGALSPLFAQNVSTLAYQGTGYTKLAPRSATGSGGAFWHQGKVYFSVTITRSTATTSSGWLVLDEQSGQWVVWELADTPRVGASVSGAVAFPSGVSTSGRKGLLSMDGTATTDNGTAIASYYTSTYIPYGEPKAEKHVRASELHGTGTVTLAWGKDLQTHGTAETVAMSSGIGHARTGARGRVLSFKIAASAAGWTVNRVVPMLQSVRTGR
jgi:hypothetical protein